MASVNTVDNTAAKLLFSTNRKRMSFLVCADKANSALIQVSQTDRGALAIFIEIGGGEFIAFNDFVGDVFGIGSTSSAQNWSVPFVQEISEEMPRYTSVVKGP